MTVKIHKKEDFEKMRSAGKLAAQVLDYITPFVKVGTTTNELDILCYNMIINNNAIPAPLNYKGYPKSICTSLNNVVCHGIPDDRKLREGDILNIDVSVILDGWHGDTSRMYWVGEVPIKAQRLTRITYESMMLGIAEVKPGARLGNIGYAIQQHAEKHNYSVVRDFCGHGIGQIFHDSPSILHFGKRDTGLTLEPGMFFTIEPMINAGDYHVKISSTDGWTATTKDRSLSAQFEHTIGVTETGYEIFTLSPNGYTMPIYQP